MEVGQSTLLELVDNFVVDSLEFVFFCLFLLLNFKPYFIMASKVISEEQLQFTPCDENPLISVLISNYPLANGGYLISFGHDKPDGSFETFDPIHSLDFEDSKLSKFLEFSSIFLPKGCYYLPEMEFAGFIKSLSFGVSAFEVKLLPASAQMQGLLLVRVDKESLFKYEQEKKD